MKYQSPIEEANNGSDFPAPWLGVHFSRKPEKGPVLVLTQNVPCAALWAAAGASVFPYQNLWRQRRFVGFLVCVPVPGCLNAWQLSGRGGAGRWVTSLLTTGQCLGCVSLVRGM